MSPKLYTKEEKDALIDTNEECLDQMILEELGDLPAERHLIDFSDAFDNYMVQGEGA